jgi:hypothetical protein
LRFRLILYEYLCPSIAVGEGYALELVGVFERDFSVCMCLLERVTRAMYNGTLFLAIILFDDGPVICGVARDTADEHFVRRSPKECEVRCACLVEVWWERSREAVERLAACEVVGIADARVEVGDV